MEHNAIQHRKGELMTQPDTSMIEDQFKVDGLCPPARGGQHVGVTVYPIKVTHLPTGIFAVCGSERSQHKNRSIAMAMVQYGLAEMGWKL
jgi:protein subunit release factor A